MRDAAADKNTITIALLMGWGYAEEPTKPVTNTIISACAMEVGKRLVKSGLTMINASSDSENHLITLCDILTENEVVPYVFVAFVNTKGSSNDSIDEECFVCLIEQTEFVAVLEKMHPLEYIENLRLIDFETAPKAAKTKSVSPALPNDLETTLAMYGYNPTTLGKFDA